MSTYNTIIIGPVRGKGRFRTEGKIHLPEWQSEGWNYEKYFKGGCLQWLKV